MGGGTCMDLRVSASLNCRPWAPASFTPDSALPKQFLSTSVTVFLAIKWGSWIQDHKEPFWVWYSDSGKQMTTLLPSPCPCLCQTSLINHGCHLLSADTFSESNSMQRPTAKYLELANKRKAINVRNRVLCVSPSLSSIYYQIKPNLTKNVHRELPAQASTVHMNQHTSVDRTHTLNAMHDVSQPMCKVRLDQPPNDDKRMLLASHELQNNALKSKS